MRSLSRRDILRLRRRLMPVPLQGLPRRPRTRGECANGPRPCPFVTCRYHLYLEATSTGSIVFNQPGKEPHELEETCALDVAERGGVYLDDVGQILGVTRERVRQLEERGLRKLAAVFGGDPEDAETGLRAAGGRQ